ncbi:12258_t:CDS:2, partial [Cetraspora pellucida]
DHMNNGILYHTKDDIEFTLPSNECVIDVLPVVRYVNEDNIFEDDKHENEPGTFFVVENADDNIFEDNNPESESNILTVIRNVEDNIHKSEDSENKPKDSPLKEIYIGQTFTSFECLNKLISSCWYSEESLAIFEKIQGSSVQVIQNKDEPLPTSTFQALERICEQETNIRNAIELDSKKVSYGCSLRLCKKALNIAIKNSSNNVLEDILQ